MASSRSVLWFRRDLRMGDNPALLAAVENSPDGVLPLFVLDPKLWQPSGDARRSYLLRSLRSLTSSLGNALQVTPGDPVSTVRESAQSVGATKVYIAADFGPYGAQRDQAVERSLSESGIELIRIGSPYTVAPGRVTKEDGTPYRVYSPFYRAWVKHGWRPPAADPQTVSWLGASLASEWPTEPDTTALQLPEAGEAAALERWAQFAQSHLDDYAEDRNRPDLPGSSRMSVHLKYGEVHPRTLLADLGDSKSHEVYRKELAWREFYADVLHHRPDTAREYLRPEFAGMEYDVEPSAGDRLHAWQQGLTGYPIVDAGMRQLLVEGWMHNRVRMIVASFLVKDLHLEWQVGARWFMRHLVDGDVASNSHGWQWTAGCGTDAAPYFRIFNPTTQALRFDPEGSYVRQYVPELRHLADKSVHEPWSAVDGYQRGYPRPIVDHAVERQEALLRYATIKVT
jgi:deoxyribodipyrimidine photo-lyase